jgi:hypothetical protein
MHHLVLCVLALASTNVVEGRSSRQGVLVVQGTQIRQLDDPKSHQDNVMVRPPNQPLGDKGGPLDAPLPGESLENGSGSTIAEPTVALTIAPSGLNAAGNAPVSTMSEPTIDWTRAPSILETGGNAPVSSTSESPIASTRAPSKEPSSHAPTTAEYQLLSNLPSDIPSALPSDFQSPLPTRQQTTVATIYPTALPSSSSTGFPMWEPTPNLTQVPSPSPVNDPTYEPSRKWEPTPYFTQVPSPSPMNDPTHEPSRKGEPTPYLTQVPSPSPLNDPTHEPSHKPTDAPSSMPSVFPSASAMPTNSAFVTIPIDESGNPTGDGDNSIDQNGGGSGGGALLSECADQLAHGTEASTNVYEFQYVLILKPPVSADSVVMDIEPILHRQFGVEFLTCDSQEQRSLQKATNAEPFTVIDLSSLPVDKVASSACDNDDVQSSDAGFNCFLVDAGFTSKMLFSASSEEVLQTIASFLTELMESELWHDTDPNIHRLAFRGFSEGMVIVTPTPPTDSERNANGAESMTSPMDVGGIVGGTVAVVIAALAALLAVFFASKRRQREKLYNKQMNEGFLDEGSGGTLEVEGVPSFIVVQDDESKASSGYAATSNVVASYRENVAAWGHDSRTCKSTTCAECQADKLLAPTFVLADVMAAHIKRDLAPARPPQPRPGFRPNDTVDL